MKLINNILVYIDDSDSIIEAIEYGVLLSKIHGAKLYGLYVVNTKALSDLLRARIFIESEQDEYARELSEDGDRYLKTAKKLANSKEVEIEVVKKEGAPVSVIRTFCEDNDIDLLVIGSDRESNFKSAREELRSIKELTSIRVACNVLVVKESHKIEAAFATGV